MSRWAATVVFLLTVPMLLLHAGVLAGAWGLTALVRRSLARLARLTPWRTVPAPAPLVVPARPGAVVGRVTVPASRVPSAVLLLRGPPAAVPA